MPYEVFVSTYGEPLNDYWDRIKTSLLTWRNSYEWQGVKLNGSIGIRDRLESLINDDLNKMGYLSKRTFDAVMRWGFKRPSSNSAADIATATDKAFNCLCRSEVASSAMELTNLPGIGISRATKVIALSNQKEYGIYDSRAAYGLSDLRIDGRKFIPIPPGRSVVGDAGSNHTFCKAFERYIWTLRYLHSLANDCPSLISEFPRVADIEIALFSRGRNWFSP